MGTVIRCDNQCGAETTESAAVNWWTLDILGRRVVTTNQDAWIIAEAPHHFCSLFCLWDWAGRQQDAGQVGVRMREPAEAPPAEGDGS